MLEVICPLLDGGLESQCSLLLWYASAHPEKSVFAGNVRSNYFAAHLLLAPRPFLRFLSPKCHALYTGFPSLHRVGVGLLAFSPDGHWLASMGHDPQHTLGVYS